MPNFPFTSICNNHFSVTKIEQHSFPCYYKMMQFTILIALPKIMGPCHSYALLKAQNAIENSESAVFFIQVKLFSWDIHHSYVIQTIHLKWKWHRNQQDPYFLLHKHCCSINKFAKENEMEHSSDFTLCCSEDISEIDKLG